MIFLLSYIWKCIYYYTFQLECQRVRGQNYVDTPLLKEPETKRVEAFNAAVTYGCVV